MSKHLKYFLIFSLILMLIFSISCTRKASNQSIESADADTSTISNNTDLIEGVNETYILDFNTSLREIGDYALYVTMQKNNYEVRTALIDLTVNTRVFSATLQPEKFTDNINGLKKAEMFY